MSRTFKSLEHQGWSERAAVYDTHTARFTSYGIDPLLDAIRIEPGLSVLDVCCGTGLAAQAAASEGARVTGIDISSEMIALARAKSPAATSGSAMPRHCHSMTRLSTASSATSGSSTCRSPIAPWRRRRGSATWRYLRLHDWRGRMSRPCSGSCRRRSRRTAQWMSACRRRHRLLVWPTRTRVPAP